MFAQCSFQELNEVSRMFKTSGNKRLHKDVWSWIENGIATFSGSEIIFFYKGRRGRDHMVVGSTTIPVQSVPITTNVLSSNPAHDEVYTIQLGRYNIMW